MLSYETRENILLAFILSVLIGIIAVIVWLTKKTKFQALECKIASSLSS